MEFPSYKELLKMKDGGEAVELLFKRAQKEYVKVFQEMVEQEKIEHTLKKAFGTSKTEGVIFDTFTKKESIEANIELFNRAALALGEENVIKNHENAFFNLLFYKFCEDYKYFHKK